MIHKRYDRAFMANTDQSFYYEYLLTSGTGAYSSGTLGGCNTRKYHSLLTVLQPSLDGNDHVLFSSLDETLVVDEKSYELGTHLYPRVIHPRGYELADEFTAWPVPQWTYRVGGCTLTKELLMPDNEDAVLVRYSLTEASGPVTLRLSPLVAFRVSHSISKANDAANMQLAPLPNGYGIQPYGGYQQACIQTSAKCAVTPRGEWHYNIEYPVENARGHEYHEDLMAPGNLEVRLNPGDKLVVYLGLTECQPKTLATRFASALKKKHTPRTTADVLQHAAAQFIVKRDSTIQVRAGFPWFGFWGRDKFISLPGLFLETRRVKEYKKVLDAALPDLKDGLFPNVGTGEHAIYNTVDSSLWFIWALQQFTAQAGGMKKIWKDYGDACKHILEHYRNGTRYNIKMDTDGLITQGQEGYSLTWMDAVVDGHTITPRRGKAVEINALWYNAVCYCLEAAAQAKDKAFMAEWNELPERIRTSFINAYWDEQRQYLADVIDLDGHADIAVRPNQVFAISMPYSPLPNTCWTPVLTTVRQELRTHKGLKTLNEDDNCYMEKCEGDQHARDHAYHQGTIWPWLLGHYAEACIKVYGQQAAQEVREIYADLETMLGDICINSIPEIYNAAPPHEPTGAVAQAWSVAEALRIGSMLEKLNGTSKNKNNDL